MTAGFWPELQQAPDDLRQGETSQNQTWDRSDPDLRPVRTGLETGQNQTLNRSEPDLRGSRASRYAASSTITTEPRPQTSKPLSRVITQRGGAMTGAGRGGGAEKIKRRGSREGERMRRSRERGEQGQYLLVLLEYLLVLLV